MGFAKVFYVILLACAAAGITASLMSLFVKKQNEELAHTVRLDKRVKREIEGESRTGASVVNRPATPLPAKSGELFDIDRTERPSVAPSSHPVYAQVTQSVQQFPVRSLRDRRHEDDTDIDIIVK